MQDEASYETKLMVWDSDISQAYYILPPFQITRHPKNLRESKQSTKIIERNIKIYDIKLMYYENITNKESNGT